MLQKTQFQYAHHHKRNKSFTKNSENRKRLSTHQCDDQKLRKYSSTKHQRPNANGKSYYLKTQYQSKPDFSKIFPTNITIEKEKMYSQLLLLKKKCNLLQSDNHKLKTKLKIYEQEKVKLITQLEENEKFIPMVSWGTNYKQPGNLISILKQQNRKWREQNQKQRRQIQKLKKNIKTTKLSELQIQNQNLSQQIQRLTIFINQNNIIQNNNKIKQQQFNSLQEKIIQRDKELSNLKKELQDCKLYTEKIIKDSQSQKINYMETVQKLNKQIDLLKKNLQNKEVKIDQISKLYTQQIALTKKQKQKKQKCKSSTIKRNQEIIKKECQIINHKQQQIQEIRIDISSNLKKIGQFLNFKLRAHHIQKQQFNQFLFPYNLVSQDKKIKKNYIINVLSTDPFQLTSINDKIELVQYLFGDINIKNKKQQQQIANIQNRFVKIIGDYTIDHINLQDQLFIEICQIVHTSVQKIAEALSKSANGEGTIAKHELLNILKRFKFNDFQIRFVLTQISLDSRDLDHLNFYSIFDIFDQQFQKRNSINPVEQLSQQYQISQQNLNVKKSINFQEKNKIKKNNLQQQQKLKLKQQEPQSLQI